MENSAVAIDSKGRMEDYITQHRCAILRYQNKFSSTTKALQAIKLPSRANRDQQQHRGNKSSISDRSRKTHGSENFHEIMNKYMCYVYRRERSFRFLFLKLYN